MKDGQQCGEPCRDEPVGLDIAGAAQPSVASGVLRGGRVERADERAGSETAVLGARRPTVA